MPSILRVLSSSDNQDEASQLIVSIMSYKSPGLQDMNDAKIVLTAYLRTGQVVEALALARKAALTPVQAGEEVNEDASAHVSQTISELTAFIFDTCFSCRSFSQNT